MLKSKSLKWWGVRLAAVAPLTIAGAAGAGTILGTATGPGGHTYEVVSDSSLNWTGAKAAAANSGGFLATIGDAAEQSAVEKLLTDSGAPSGAYWFGLHETSTEGDYRHITGAVPTYTHWLPSQPDNFGGTENSGSILWSNAGDQSFSRRGFWNDLPDNNVGYPQALPQYPDLIPKGYVVEFKGTGAGFDNGDGDAPKSVPLPAAALAFPLGLIAAGWAAKRVRRA